MARTVKAKQNKPATWVWILGAAVVLLILAGALYLPQILNAPAQLAREVSVDQAKQLRDEGVFVLDVRQPEEWDAVHIPGATLIPLDQLEGRLGEVPKDQTVLVYCRSGNRSQSGRDILLEAGYKGVTSMAGGINEWAAAGYPTESGQ